MSVSSTTLARSLALLTVVLFSCWSALLLLNAHEGLQGDIGASARASNMLPCNPSCTVSAATKNDREQPGKHITLRVRPPLSHGVVPSGCMVSIDDTDEMVQLLRLDLQNRGRRLDRLPASWQHRLKARQRTAVPASVREGTAHHGEHRDCDDKRPPAMDEKSA